MQRLRILAAIVILGLGLATPSSASAEPLADGQASDVIAPPDGAKWRERLIFYVNGMNTKPDAAVKAGTGLGAAVGHSVRGVYLDMICPANAAVQRVTNEETAAQKTMVRLVRERLRDTDRRIFLVGYSAGSIVVSKAVDQIAAGYTDPAERKAALRRIHVLTVGGAIARPPEKWPGDLGSVHDLWHERDPIPNLFGNGTNKSAVTYHERFHDIGTYIGKITVDMLNKSGTTAAK